MQHYLWPLLRPRSVALVGASERPRSLGRTVYENLLAGGFPGALHAVNPAHKRVLDRPAFASLVSLFVFCPAHKRVLDRPAFASLADVGEPIDLAIVATPPRAVLQVLE